MIVVSNTSPITNLSAIGKLEILHNIYDKIIIPRAVYDEMVGLDSEVPGTREVQTLPRIETAVVRNLDLVSQLKTEVDPGEAEAIALAIEIAADRLILDDLKARAIAAQFDLNFIGILGLLIVAKNRGLIDSVKSTIDELINRAGFRMSSRLYDDVLTRAGERTN